MWVVGQRVRAEYEPELGLGTVIEVIGTRFVEVLFSTAEVTRRYAQKGAPLRRVVLNSGQKARLKNGQTFIVTGSREENGLFLYKGDGREAWEYELGELIEDTSPLTHLFLGKWSHPKTFSLREQAWRLRGQSLSPDLKGLVGPRVSLLPHQLYIAQQIAKRDLPRVLLADEVGLGKTIEAGLIFSALKALGRAERVLVLVPEALKHQWLAELFRRFNEMFTVLDEERHREEALSQGSSAFQMNQRIICSLDFLLEDPSRLEDALEEPWDLVIIDEAHYLQWSPEEPSTPWEAARVLSQLTRGLLLLTATPEHRGTETEFGLLQLVDPERFPNFGRFQKDAKRMHETAALARRVRDGERSAELQKALTKQFAKDEDLLKAIDAYAKGATSDLLLRRMVDRHGTGRVLIRNRRSRLQGFPERRFAPSPIEPPAEWRAHLAELSPTATDEEEILDLASGRVRQKRSAGGMKWFETRAKWMLDLLQSLGGEKALVLCSSTRRVTELQAWLRTQTPMRTGIFHEDLEIVERDRQAAWFAQPDGAQCLISSEIGGEGRNFQFARHLILFDLPLSPDTLEQRIGRLDRIGQGKQIHIHVPYFVDTPEEVLIRWFSEGLESFTQPWNGGAGLETLRKDLLTTCRVFLPRSKQHAKRGAELESLLEATRVKREEIRERQRESIDLLVDLNSFDEARGRELADRIHALDESPHLADFMDHAFDQFGVEAEEMGDGGTLKISAHSLTFVETFPGLSKHGEMLVTYDRAQALAREEVAFLTWDHPVVQGALSLVLEGELGRASAGTLPTPLRGGAVVELLYVLEATAPAYLEVERDLPVHPLKVFLALDGKPAAAPDGLETSTLTPLPPAKLAELTEVMRERLMPVVECGNALVGREGAALVSKAIERRKVRLGEELERLKQLAAINPLITPHELEESQAKLDAGLLALQDAAPRLEAVRILLGKNV